MSQNDTVYVGFEYDKDRVYTIKRLAPGARFRPVDKLWEVTRAGAEAFVAEVGSDGVTVSEEVGGISGPKPQPRALPVADAQERHRRFNNGHWRKQVTEILPNTGCSLRHISAVSEHFFGRGGLAGCSPLEAMRAADEFAKADAAGLDAVVDALHKRASWAPRCDAEETIAAARRFAGIKVAA